jgi:TRAP-type C4-dicarboxylate transport system permease small subunit
MKALTNSMQGLSRVLGWLEDALCAVALGSVALVVTGQVVSRYCFNYTPSWSEELSRYLVVWTIFVGTAVGVRKNIHIGVDALIRLAPHRVKLSLEVLLNVIGAAVSAVLIYLAVLFIQDTIEYEQLSPAMQIPMWLPYLAMPVGLGFAVVHFLHSALKVLLSGEEPHSADEAAAASAVAAQEVAP